MSENLYSTEQIDATALYNSPSILIATFIGGPLAGGYLISENFRYLGEPEKAKQTWIYAIICLSVILAISGCLQATHIPWYTVPLGYTLLAYVPLKWMQSARIKTHKNEGGSIHKSDRVFVISFVGAVATVVGLLIASILMQIAATSSSMN